MATRTLVLACLALACVGCGTSTPPADTSSNGSVLPTASAPTVSDEEAAANDAADAEGAASPANPPGKIEMPAGAVPPAPTITEDAARSSGPKSGGFEMPEAAQGAATVIAQRPVLDEPTADDKVILTAASWDKIQKQITSTGKVTVIDFWSLSCEPCLKEFPGLVKLSREHGDKIACISVDVDYDGRKSKPAETYRPRVEAFLKSADAQFTNFLCETANEDLFAALKIVSIPAVVVYDAEGNLVRTFTDTGKDVGFSYEKDIAPLVKSLVAP